MLCVLIVDGMSVIVNVMLSLVSVLSPPPALCNLSVHTAVKLCVLGVLACQKNGKSVPHCWGREGSTPFAQQPESAVTAPPLVGCPYQSNFIAPFIQTNCLPIFTDAIHYAIKK